MKTGKEKYERVLEMLRKSEPLMTDPEAFSNKVIHEIKREKSSSHLFDLISDFLFGWVYIGWVRRSLVAASFAILLIFVYQQSVILRRIKAIDSQVVFTSGQLMPGVNNSLDTKLLFRRSEYVLPAIRGTLSQRQVDELIKSFSELEVKYKDILKLINEDPELKKYIDEKLKQSERKKLKL